MAYRYTVVGAGRQGTAAAYDLLQRGDAGQVTLLDADPTAAAAAAARLTALTGRPEVAAAGLDVATAAPAELARALDGSHAVVSAVPYRLNMQVTRAALAARAHYCDFGGNTPLVRAQLELDGAAAAAGVCIVPDCGLEPGMASTLTAHALSRLTAPEEVDIWCGGLPQRPQPPFHYALGFHINGLLNEYWGHALVLRDGQVAEVPVFSGYEQVHIPGVGDLEAFATSGGTSTLPYTYAGRLRRLESKTLRYPGHYQQFWILHELGLLSPEPLAGAGVAPRDVVAQLLEPRLRARPGDPDLAVLYVRARGRQDGRPAQVSILLTDRGDPATGFTAMERTTGWHGAMVAALMAAGQVRPGARPVELAVPAAPLVAGARARGMQVQEVTGP